VDDFHPAVCHRASVAFGSGAHHQLGVIHADDATFGSPICHVLEGDARATTQL